MKKFINFFSRFPADFINSYKSFSNDEIVEIEKTAGVSFPENYKDFLLEMGKGNDLVLWHQHRLEKHFSIKNILNGHRKKFNESLPNILIATEWNTGSLTLLTPNGKIIEGEFLAYSKSYPSFESMLFTYGLDLYIKEMPSIGLTKKKPKNNHNYLEIFNKTNILEEYNLEEVPYTKLKYCQGYISKEIAIYISQYGINVAVNDGDFLNIIAQEIIELTGLVECIHTYID